MQLFLEILIAIPFAAVLLWVLIRDQRREDRRGGK